MHILLSKGADVNLRDEARKKPIHEASEKGYDSIFEFLLLKTNVYLYNLFEETTLHTVKQEGHERTMQILRSYSTVID